VELIDPTDTPESTSYYVSSAGRDLTIYQNAPDSNAPLAPPPPNAKARHLFCLPFKSAIVSEL